MIALAAKRNVKKTDDLIDVWQSPPFPNYGDTFTYSIETDTSTSVKETARGKLVVFTPLKEGQLFVSLVVDGVFTNYTPTFYIDENLWELKAIYSYLFVGQLLYVLGMEIDGNKRYFNTPFLVDSFGYITYFSVLGLEENNVAYNSVSLFGRAIEKHVVVPDNSFVLSTSFPTALALRYEFGEEETYEFYDANLIVKKPIGFTIIPSLPKVKLPIKDELVLSFI